MWKPRLSAFIQALADLGWPDGRNVRMEVRSGRGDNNRIRALAQELVSLQADIIVTNTTAATVALQRETRTIPMVSMQRSKRPFSRLGASREAALSSCRMDS